MQTKDTYKNGQRVYEQDGETLTYFFKTGVVKATGPSVGGVMQGEWRFFRETGDLWQVGNFRDGAKHGEWVRYGPDGEVEYRETFAEGRKARRGAAG